METLGGPDYGPRAVCWTTSIILICNKIHNWDILVLACPGCPGKRPLNEWLYCLNCVLFSILMKFLKTGIDRFICITCDVASWYSFPFYIIVASDSSKWVEDKSRAVLESIMKSRRWMVEELISECVCFTWCHFAAINLHFCLISLFFQICLHSSVGGKNGIWPVKNSVVCWWWWADWSCKKWIDHASYWGVLVAVC